MAVFHRQPTGGDRKYAEGSTGEYLGSSLSSSAEPLVCIDGGSFQLRGEPLRSHEVSIQNLETMGPENMPVPMSVEDTSLSQDAPMQRARTSSEVFLFENILRDASWTKY